MLLLSLMTTFAGPALFLWLSRGGRLAQTIDRFIVIVLVLLVTVLLVPESIEALGWQAIGLVVGGYLLPGILEFTIRRAAETLHLASLLFALFGLLIHALLDGVGLAGSEIGAGESLGLAIILHRFGVGLMLWLVVQPVFGDKAAWLTLVCMAAATVLGFEFSERLLPFAGDQAIAIIQAVIIGTIVHSLVHRGHAKGHTGHQH